MNCVTTGIITVLGVNYYTFSNYFPGKSNLMDAISFVFGEKTSSLRVKTVKVCKYMYVLLVLEYNTLVLLHK
jgi:hypothetical protein